MNRNRKLTQAQIAKELGISQSAVSLTLNDPETKRVSPATRDRILELVRAHSPDAVPQRQKTLCFLMEGDANTDNPYFTRLLSGIEDEAKSFSCNIMFKRWASRDELLSLASIPTICGAIHLGHMPKDLLTELNQSLPTIIVNHIYDDLICDMVTIDNHGGIQQAVRHLKEMGHSRIAYVGPVKSTGGVYGHDIERLGGFYEAMISLGLPLNPDHIIDERDRFKSFDEIMEFVLTTPNHPTAAVTFNDGVALGLMRSAAQLGRQLPEEFSVIGFDNTPEGANWPVPLTSVHQNREDMGRLAVRVLMEKMEQPALGTFRKVLCRTELITRESVTKID